MERPPTISRLSIRLVREELSVATRSGARADQAAGETYHPLAIGAAVALRPQSAGGRWVVRVSGSGLLQPRGPRSLPAAIARAEGLVASGIVARAAVALLAPEDFTASSVRSRRVPAFGRLRHDCYGWSLLYQLPGMRGMAWIDPHERFADLPAFYESPLEYLDRAAFLAERGIPSRPLALVTQPCDFQPGPDGDLRNLFYPRGGFRRRRGDQQA